MLAHTAAFTLFIIYQTSHKLIITSAAAYDGLDP